MQSFYQYETHLHTSEASACGVSSGAEMAVAHKEKGYDGVIVTDHFFNGNTAVPRDLPWAERVERFCLGYRHCRETGEKIGLQVFFGWEYGYYGTEFLTYGLDEQWLLSHPDILSWPLDEYFRRVHADGGFITHAHPFRQASYIPEIRLFPDQVDAVEVINASHCDPLFNMQAREYAAEQGLPAVSGSDTHNATRLFGGGMQFDHRLNSIQDYIKAVRSGQGRLLGE